MKNFKINDDTKFWSIIALSIGISWTLGSVSGRILNKYTTEDNTNKILSNTYYYEELTKDTNDEWISSGNIISTKEKVLKDTE